MLETRVTVVNRLGLHARAAAQLVRMAGHFASRVTIYRTDSSAWADAKSILSLLTLSASVNTELLLKVEGTDEVEALQAINTLFASGFGEN